MLRRGFLLLHLLLASLIATATVHAQEFSPSPALECAGYIHTEGDADQSPGDSDKAVPHHHTSCQSAPVSSPTRIIRERRLRPLVVATPNYVSALTHRWSNGPGLRPPIA